MPLADPVSLLILDTNVVLDWLVFHHPWGAALERALTGGHWRWIATAAMHDELDHVLARGALDRWQPDAGAIRAARERWATPVSAPDGQSLARIRCTDPDDQKFIDLALHVEQATLLSRDRAVLKLARRVREGGVSILTPESWQPTLAPG